GPAHCDAFVLVRRPPQTPTPFPYTTLFRSEGPAHLVGLEVADHMPLDRPVAEGGGLLHELLDAVLPEERGSGREGLEDALGRLGDRKSTRLNSSHVKISYAVFCLKKKKQNL